MFGASSVPFWTAMAAVAGMLQVVALVVTARFVWRYLKETEQLRKTAQRQVAAADDQLEAQIRPAVVIKVRAFPHGLLLVNLGKGPALGVTLSPTKRGAAAGFFSTPDEEIFGDNIPFLEAGGEQMTSVRPNPVGGLGGVPVLSGRSLQCQYTSLSGHTYWTVVDFDHPVWQHYHRHALLPGARHARVISRAVARAALKRASSRRLPCGRAQRCGPFLFLRKQQSVGRNFLAARSGFSEHV